MSKSYAKGEVPMKLKEALKKSKFVVTSEIQAPEDVQQQELISNLNLIRGRVDGVSVSDMEIEGVVGDSIATCELLKQNRFEAIYQTTTRQKTAFSCKTTLFALTARGWKTSLSLPKITALPEIACRRSCFFMWTPANCLPFFHICGMAGRLTEKECLARPISFWGPV